MIWNSPEFKDDPLAPHNNPMYKDDPFKPWNDPTKDHDNLTFEEASYYGISRFYMDDEEDPVEDYRGEENED